MAKFCPECGCKLNHDEKTCPECGINLNFSTEKSDKGWGLPKILVAVGIVAVIIFAAFILITGNFTYSENILVTVSESGEWISSYGNNTTMTYSYYVNGYISGIPSDSDKYFLRTIYYDSNNTELGKTTENLQKIHFMLSETDLHAISLFLPKNQVYVDHITIQVVKDNEVLKEFNESFDSNNVEFFN